jgi:hypothetical protein
MSSQQVPQLNIDRYVVIHVATTCDEHGVYVTKDSAEVIELGWILLDANTLEEVRKSAFPPLRHYWATSPCPHAAEASLTFAASQ